MVGFDLVMLWLLEVPLLSSVLAPEWTPRAIEYAKVWVGRHSQMFAVSGQLLGVLLIIKGVVGIDLTARSLEIVET